MDKPNGISWGSTEIGNIINASLQYKEAFFLHDPSENINDEVDFFPGDEHVTM